MLHRACVLTVQDSGVFYSKVQFPRRDLRSKLGSYHYLKEVDGQKHTSQSLLPSPPLSHTNSTTSKANERYSLSISESGPSLHSKVAPSRALCKTAASEEGNGKDPFGPDKPSAKHKCGRRKTIPKEKASREKCCLEEGVARLSWQKPFVFEIRKMEMYHFTAQL